MTVATGIRTVEWLTFQPASQRGEQMRHEVARTADAFGARVVATQHYQGDADVLMLWGPGAPDRFGPMAHQIETGRHVVCWDLAYWARDLKIRCSVDHAHPQDWVMRYDWPTTRLQADRVRIADLWDPKGHVLVAGIGEKAKVQYGAARVARWEQEQIAACQARGKCVYYRRKKASGAAPAGVALLDHGDIAMALTGASLLVTWHSNAAVDAIRLGIPVVCMDGAAAAVCPRELPTDPRPLPELARQRFLSNLAWFQWAPTEGVAFWRFLTELLA